MPNVCVGNAPGCGFGEDEQKIDRVAAHLVGVRQPEAANAAAISDQTAAV